MPTIELINDDCMNVMAKYPDKYFDLAIVDPPYGINILERGVLGSNNCGKVKDYGKKGWDLDAPPVEYFFELSRVSKHQIVWGANHFISRMPYNSSCWVVWDKDNTGGYADCELAWASFPTAVRKFKHRWNGMLQQDMKNKEVRIHPTQKPTALYKWLLQMYAEKGQKILDTHLGSGSIAIACHYFGCDLVATEIDKDYYEAAVKRFNENTKQTVLF